MRDNTRYFAKILISYRGDVVALNVSEPRIARIARTLSFIYEVHARAL